MAGITSCLQYGYIQASISTVFIGPLFIASSSLLWALLRVCDHRRWEELVILATEMLEGVAITARNFRLCRREERETNRKLCCRNVSSDFQSTMNVVKARSSVFS